jgi:hypothetical protein
VTRLSALARRHGFDLLIALLALESASEVVIRHDDALAPASALWFAAPASACVVLPLLGRRRFPFAAPAAVWLLAALLSFVDGRLVPFTLSASVAGMCAAVLLGHLRDEVQARMGLVIVVCGAAIIVYNGPDDAVGEYVVAPALFAIGWLAGFALRERAEQAAAAETRALAAERERDAASPSRRGGGARADRPRDARHRRPRRERDGAAGRGRQAPPARGGGARSGGARERRARRPHSAGRDAPAAGGDARRR